MSPAGEIETAQADAPEREENGDQVIEVNGRQAVRVILLGPPGAGKGTQAVRIAKAYDVPHISTGDIFRANVKDETELGRQAKQYMDAGELVPDDVVISMVADRLEQPDTAAGFVLDGFPRTVAQADALEEILSDLGRPVDAVLRLAVDEEEIVRRLTGRRTCSACGAVFHLEHQPPEVEGRCDRCGGEIVQRDDDSEQVVLHRLDVYHRQTEPLELFYWQRGLLREIAAIGSLDDITARILGVLGEYASPSGST